MRIGRKVRRAAGRNHVRASADGEKKPLPSHSEDIPVSQCDGFCLRYPLVILFRGDRHAMFDLSLPGTSMLFQTILSILITSFFVAPSGTIGRRNCRS